MKLASEAAAGLWVPIKPALEAVLTRLEALSMEPGFSPQRQLAMSRALRRTGQPAFAYNTLRAHVGLI